MTIGADDVAFRNFGQKAFAWHEHRSRCRDVERLDPRVPVVEVHLVRQESAAAIFARNPAQVAKERERHPLPGDHAIELTLSISLVVADVVGTLVTRAWHRPKMTQAPESRQ